ncbi:MAG: DNA primase [Candidatus Paceibacterota bacterium]
MNSVDEIKSKLDIVDVVESYVTLTRSGTNSKARCPFHNERTPSFSVSSERQMYYCFGCGAGGDMINFVERIEGVDFYGAMKILADRAGVTFEPITPEKRNEKDTLYELLEEACLYYSTRLEGAAPVQSYLNGRGVSEASISVWRLGYAPSEWRALYEHLSAKGYADDDLITAGLVKRSGKPSTGSPRLYDTFRDRIVFPIKDPAGRVIAFSGRIFQETDDAPKYLNSPDTPIFHKSNVLYGLDRAKQAIRQMDFTTLVEGQMDLVLSHQRGFQNTVATSGTAITRDHLSRLNRLSQKLMLAFDGDSAGVSAVQKSAGIALALGMDVKVAVAPAGEDPADVLVRDPAEWKAILGGAKPVVTFLVDNVLAEAGSDTREVARRVAKDVLPYVAALPQASEQSYFITEMAQATGLREDALWSDLKKTTPATGSHGAEERASGSTASDSSVGVSPREETPAGRNRLTLVARDIAGLILWQQAKEDAQIDVAAARAKLEERLGKDAQTFLDTVADHPDAVFRIEQQYGESSITDTTVAELFRALDIELLVQRRDRVRAELRASEHNHDEEAIEKKMKAFQELQGQLDRMRRSEDEAT